MMREMLLDIHDGIENYMKIMGEMGFFDKLFIHGILLKIIHW